MFFVTLFFLIVNVSSLQCWGVEQGKALFTKIVEFTLRACMTANLSLASSNNFIYERHQYQFKCIPYMSSEIHQ